MRRCTSENTIKNLVQFIYRSTKQQITATKLHSALSSGYKVHCTTLNCESPIPSKINIILTKNLLFILKNGRFAYHYLLGNDAEENVFRVVE